MKHTKGSEQGALWEDSFLLQIASFLKHHEAKVVLSVFLDSASKTLITRRERQHQLNGNIRNRNIQTDLSGRTLQCVYCNSCCGISPIWTHIQTYFVILICIVFQFDYEQLVKVRVGETLSDLCCCSDNSWTGI